MRDDGHGENVRWLRSFAGARYGGPHTRSAVVDGAHVSNVCQESEYFCDVERDADVLTPGRLECNPNKLTARVLYLLSCFEPHHVSRCDVALDYEDVPVGAFVWHRDRVKACTWTGAGGVESLVLGAASSDRRVRVYDKALEVGFVGLVLTRVEGMGRKHHALSDELLDGVHGYRRAVAPDLGVRDAGLLALYLYHPEVLRAGADKRTIRRAKDLAAANADEISPRPEDVYRDALPMLRDRVAAVASGERVPVARVYAGKEAAPAGCSSEGLPLGGGTLHDTSAAC